tara:strand:- start:30 stop:158 length:129 start_codon:yes stop_codon:yes gene_type:complete
MGTWADIDEEERFKIVLKFQNLVNIFVQYKKEKQNDKNICNN